MFVTERDKPLELMQLEAADKRTELTEAETSRLQFLSLGYRGECEFDQLIEESGHNNNFIFRDIWIEVNKGHTQIDSLIINDSGIVLGEIKNFSGKYMYEDGEWKRNGRKFSDNPVPQVQRAAQKVEKLLKAAGLTPGIEKKLMMVNPNLELVCSDGVIGDMIVMRNHMLNYLKSMNRTSCKSPFVHQVIEIIEHAMIENPYPPDSIGWDRITVGAGCSKCGALNCRLTRYHLKCMKCHNTSSLEREVLQHIIHFSLLFPGTPLTKHEIHRFLGGEVSITGIRDILRKYCIHVSKGRYQLRSHNIKDILKKTGYKSRYEQDVEYKFLHG